MEKKRVLIVMPAMFIGGAERSLLGLLDATDYGIYDVSLFLYRHEGEFMPYLNRNVHLLPPMAEYETFDVPVRSLLFSRKAKYGLLRLKAKLDQKSHAKKKPDEDGVWMHMQKISAVLQSSLPDIPGEYDLAIMYLGIPDTLVNKVHAKVKMAWNHTDYTTLGPDREYDLKTYSGIDYIVSVSEECRNQFLKVYPQLEDKAIVMENILSAELIRQLAQEPADDMVKESGETVFLSIGRYCYAKNFDNVPEICRLLNAAGKKVKWYLIGFGGDEQLIRDAVMKAGVQERVILLGKKVNPYPYIRKCDVYLQPSRYEGKSVTVREAQLLGKPVIITDYATAHSQLEDGFDGRIVPLENHACANAISSILDDPGQLSQIAEYCLTKDYTNRSETKVLEACLKE